MSPMRSVHVEHALSLVDKHAKKQRHRHSQVQLAALNDLYEKTKHPSLEDRTSLAESLGMCAPYPIIPFYNAHCL
jgi:hypothetical protein